MNLTERLAEAREELAGVKAAVEGGEKGADELSAAIERVKDAQARLDAAEEAAGLLERLGGEKSAPAEKEEKEMAKTIGELAAERVKGQSVHEKFSVGAEFKAAANMLTPESISGALTTYDTNLVLQPRERLVLEDLFGSETISGNALTYYVEGNYDQFSQGMPGVVEEGVAKPKVSFSDPLPVTVPLTKIAAHYKESDEIIEDAPWLVSSINNRGIYLHQRAVEKFLLDVLVDEINSNPIGVSPESIFEAMTAVRQNSPFEPDAIVINPADYQALRLAKDGNGQYYGGGYFAGPYGNGGVMENPPIWGLRTVVSNLIPSGQAIVGAFRLGASIVRKGGMRVEMANTNEDDFIRNMVTIVIEERLALAVRYPWAFAAIGPED